MCRETPILDGDPGLFRLASNQPCIPVAKSDFTCRELAFGRWAMPKLVSIISKLSTLNP